MPMYRVSKVSSSRRCKVLITRIASKGIVAEMLHSGYTTSRSLHIFSPSSTRCAKYVRYNVRYDSNFSADDFDRLTIKQRKLEAIYNVILERVL
jgi:hypothetical protein